MNKRLYLLDELTKREKEVLEYLPTGRTNKEIAKCLNVTSKTIEAHRSNIFSKLGAVNVAQCIYNACKLELL